LVYREPPESFTIFILIHIIPCLAIAIIGTWAIFRNPSKSDSTHAWKPGGGFDVLIVLCWLLVVLLAAFWLAVAFLLQPGTMGWALIHGDFDAIFSSAGK
jgi:hypothetical protein